MEQCNCSSHCMREGVHLPGCPLHPSNRKERQKEVLETPDYSEYELRCFAGKFSETRAEGFLEGYKAALRTYAWWKDGVQYIGCGNRTLKGALEELEKGEVNEHSD